MPLGNLEPPRVAPLDRAQPSLALTQTIAARGANPQPGGSALNTIGMIQSFAGSYEPFDAFPCVDARFPVVYYPELSAIVGTRYSGDGTHSFGVPELRGRTAIGLAPDWGAPDGSEGLTFLIAAEGAGTAPATYPMTGAIGLFTGADAPGGWLPADGRMLPVAEHTALFDVIGNAFGGDGQAGFALPNLNGRAAIGAGQGHGLAEIKLGETVAGTPHGVPGLGLTFLINVGGAVPPRTGDQNVPATLSMLGQVIAFAGSAVPDGWAPAAGQLLSVAQNRPLYAILGTTFGGDGQRSFALPDLRGRMMTGADNVRPLYGAMRVETPPGKTGRAGRTPARTPTPSA